LLADQIRAEPWKNIIVHELSVTKGILEIVNDKALVAAGKAKVRSILVQVGELSGVEPGSVSFYFDIMRKDYGLEEASINFVLIPAVMKCAKCGIEFKYEPLAWNCPSCGDPGLSIIAGSDCCVESIEVDE
jgi:hydrogenase nickel incorporation protein HypA/HybF